MAAAVWDPAYLCASARCADVAAAEHMMIKSTRLFIATRMMVHLTVGADQNPADPRDERSSATPPTMNASASINAVRHQMLHLVSRAGISTQCH